MWNCGSNSHIRKEQYLSITSCIHYYSNTKLMFLFLRARDHNIKEVTQRHVHDYLESNLDCTNSATVVICVCLN